MSRWLMILVVGGVVFGAAQAQEAPKPTATPPTVARKELNLPPGAEATAKRKPPEPSPKEKALAAQLRQLEQQRDRLIQQSIELERKRLNTTDPAERKRLDQQKMALVRQMDEVVRKRNDVYKAWQNAAVERWRKENPEAFQSPPGAPPGATPPAMNPQVLARQIQIAEQQLAKLKQQGKPDTDPQVKMYRERVERYKRMMQSVAVKPPASAAPKPAQTK